MVGHFLNPSRLKGSRAASASDNASNSSSSSAGRDAGGSPHMHLHPYHNQSQTQAHPSAVAAAYAPYGPQAVQQQQQQQQQQQLMYPRQQQPQQYFDLPGAPATSIPASARRILPMEPFYPPYGVPQPHAHMPQHMQQQQPSTTRPSTAPQHQMLRAPYQPPHNLTAEAVAALPPPGLSGPSGLTFSPKRPNPTAPSPDGSPNIDSDYLVFVSTSSSSRSSSGSRRSRNHSASAGKSSLATSDSAGATSPAPTTASPSSVSGERQLCSLNLTTLQLRPLLRMPSKRRLDTSQDSASSGSSRHGSKSGGTGSTATPAANSEALSLEERLRRERQRLHSSGGVTQFSWCWVNNTEIGVAESGHFLRLLVPIRGSLYVQDGIVDSATSSGMSSSVSLKIVYDKHSQQPPAKTAAIDPQLSPDGTMLAFCAQSEVWVSPCHECHPPTQITFGATSSDPNSSTSITHGLADFVAQEEMDRYRGYWWAPDSSGILFARVDESHVPPYRILHYDGGGGSAAFDGSGTDSAMMYEDHRYPFCGKANPLVRLGYIPLHTPSLLRKSHENPQQIAMNQWQGGVKSEPNSSIAASDSGVIWFDPPREASEYLARVTWLPDGSACAQWQNRTQTCLVLTRMDRATGKSRTLLVERSDTWINLHHMFRILDRPIHPKECGPRTPSPSQQYEPPLPVLPDELPAGSFSFLFCSERSGFSHLYLFTYVPGYNSDHAMLMRQVSGGNWMVEGISGIDLPNNVVYVTGTYDSALERHLYALPIVTDASVKGPTATRGENNIDGRSHFTIPIADMDTDAVSASGSITDMSVTPPPSSPGGPANGVRRGLKQVMNALSGKSLTHHHHQSGHHHAPQQLRQQSPPGFARGPDGHIAPVRMTLATGMHNIVMNPECTMFVDTSSDLGRPTSVKMYRIPEGGPFNQATGVIPSGRRHQHTHQLPQEGISTPSKSIYFDVRSVFVLYDALTDDKSIDKATDPTMLSHLPEPELLTFPSSDGTETLHAALYKPDSRIHGPGPYPLICAVYGGPHVQRVNRSWSQNADMRAQRLRSLGFAVVKCDNRGSSRRGLDFESAISRRLGRLEVLDQVAVVRQLTVRGIADPTRVGIYGWSYGGYLSAMCLCRAPEVFHVAVAGAPVTSWDGYDTHYTERYMGLPSENPDGYRESAVLDHVPNMRGKLLLVHGLIDENVHFRHTARLVNRLIAAGKDYDLLLFPDERHSPRRLRDRIYMEQRISEYFLKHFQGAISEGNNIPGMLSGSGASRRAMTGI